MFMMRMGQRFRCQNPECRAVVEVTKDSMEGNSNPRCCCGAEMKKLYTAPVLRTLEKDRTDLAEFFSKTGSR
jgi:hypothetical protein